MFREMWKSAFVLVEQLCDVEVLQQASIPWKQLVLMHTSCHVCYVLHMIVYTLIEWIQ